MATKTFTQAQLNASDLNTFASKGDTFIASASVTAGQINQCFGTAYENYKIVVSNYFATADSWLWFQLGSGGIWSGGNYYQGGSYQAYSTGTISALNNNNTAPYFYICGGCTTATNFPNSAVMNISQPDVSATTKYTLQGTYHLAGGIWMISNMGNHNVVGRYDSFRWGTTAGAVSSGNITVYGVMQA
jgi:hypothetical protein